MKLSDCGFSSHEHGFTQFHSKSEEGTEWKMCANEANWTCDSIFFFIYLFIVAVTHIHKNTIIGLSAVDAVTIAFYQILFRSNFEC